MQKQRDTVTWEGDFWDDGPRMPPLCPPENLDPFEAFRRLHREFSEWVELRGFDGAQVLYREPGENGAAAQITWLQGPKNWTVGLLNGRSYGQDGWTKDGMRYYLEPQNEYTINLMRL